MAQYLEVMGNLRFPLDCTYHGCHQFSFRGQALRFLAPMFFASQPGEIIVDTGDIIIRFPLERPAQVMNPVFVLIRKSKVEKDRPGPLPVATSTDPAEDYHRLFFCVDQAERQAERGDFFQKGVPR